MRRFIITFLFVYIHPLRASPQACLCFSFVYISVYKGTDGPGMHQPFHFRVLAWCLPNADGVNHRPFRMWQSFQCEGVWGGVTERKDGRHTGQRQRQEPHEVDGTWDNFQLKQMLVIFLETPRWHCHSACCFSFTGRGSWTVWWEEMRWACLHNWPVSQECLVVGRLLKRRDPVSGGSKTANFNLLKPQ